jgi:hypothetical protein
MLFWTIYPHMFAIQLAMAVPRCASEANAKASQGFLERKMQPCACWGMPQMVRPASMVVAASPSPGVRICDLSIICPADDMPALLCWHKHPGNVRT